MGTKIEWCDETINPIQDMRKGKAGRGYHCTKCSPGCEHCYAERINQIRGNGLPFDESPVEFEIEWDVIEKYRGWKKRRSIFWQSMGDLFHEDMPDALIKTFFNAMATDILQPFIHANIILTKRPKRMKAFFETHTTRGAAPWPNLYLGLSICNQQEADEKIPIFLQVPGKKILSIEPCLGPVDITRLYGKVCIGGHCDICVDALRGKFSAAWRGRNTPPQNDLSEIGISGIDAVILGGETGSGARPMHPDWARKIRIDCAVAGVPFFFKQWGEWVHESMVPAGRADDYIKFPKMGQRFGDHFFKIGSKTAGRLLDGLLYDDLPWRGR